MNALYGITEYSLIILLGLVVSVIIVGRARLLRAGGLAAFYLSVFAATYLIRPVLSTNYDDLRQLDYLGVPFTNVALPIALGATLALVSFAVGYRLLSPSKWQLGHSESFGALARSFDVSRAKLWTLVMVGVGYVGLLLFQDNPFTGLRGIRMDYVVDASVFTNTTGYLTNANYLILPSMALLYCLIVRLDKVLLLSLPFLVSRAWLGWQRQILMQFGLSLLFAWVLASRITGRVRKRQFSIIAGLLVLILVLVTLHNQNRDFLRQALSGAEAEVDTSLDSAVDTWISSNANPISGFEGTAYMFYYCPRYVPHANGKLIFYTWFILPIPRLLWSGKPVRYDLIGWTDRRLFGNGMVLGSLGDAYWNFGWLGVAVIFLITGLIMGFAERRLSRNPTNPFVLAGYAGFASFVFMMGRNSVFDLVPQWLLYWFLPLLTVYFLSRIRERPARVGTVPSIGALTVVTRQPPATRRVRGE